jgi:hypothetical protein
MKEVPSWDSRHNDSQRGNILMLACRACEGSELIRVHHAREPRRKPRSETNSLVKKIGDHCSDRNQETRQDHVNLHVDRTSPKE